jgi:hypothetical protein
MTDPQIRRGKNSANCKINWRGQLKNPSLGKMGSMGVKAGGRAP